MPVGQPPLGGPLGRSRNRLSASALTTYLRCEKQWFLAYQVGLHGPLRPSQVAGIVLEDALCELFMMHPPLLHQNKNSLIGPNRILKLRLRKHMMMGERTGMIVCGQKTGRLGMMSPLKHS